MADLITRIRLEDKQFDNTIKKSRQSLNGFKGQALAMAGSLANMAGGLGVAATAAGSFKAIIDGSQTTADAFDVAIAGARASVDHFFQSISTGDWSNLFSGMDIAISQAKEYAKLMDSLGDKKAGEDYFKAREDTQFQKYRAVITDPKTSKDEKADALDKLNKLQESIEKAGLLKQQNALEAQLAYFKEKTTDMDIGKKDIDAYFNILRGLDNEYNAYEEKLKDLEALKANSYEQVPLAKGGVVTSPSSRTFELDAEIENLKKQNPELAKQYRQVDLIKDKHMQDLIQRERDAESALGRVYSMQNQVNRLTTRVEGKGAGVNLIPEGSLADISKQISDAKKRFNEAISDSARQEAEALIKELEQKKLTIEVAYKYSDTGNITPGPIAPINTHSLSDSINEIARLNKELDEAKERQKRAFNVESIEKANAEVRELTENIKLLNDAKGVKPLLNEDNENLPDFEKPKGLSDTITAVNDLSGAIGIMGNALDNGAGQWLSWGANVLSAVGTAIPAILALTTAEKTKAKASEDGAVKGAASAVAGIPIVGPIMAVAAVASIIAAFASIPKFEFGGVVGGNSYTGDKILARVNSGELILNKRQQEVIYGALQGEANKIQLAPAEVRIRGRDLVGILNQEAEINRRM